MWYALSRYFISDGKNAIFLVLPLEIWYHDPREKMEQAMAQNDGTNAYELVYEHDRKVFLQKDPAKIAEITGTELKNGKTIVPYFNRVLAVDISDGSITYADRPQEDVPVYPRMITLHHLNGAKNGARVSGVEIPFRQIPMAAVFDSAFEAMALTPMAEGFSVDKEINFFDWMKEMPKFSRSIYD